MWDKMRDAIISFPMFGEGFSVDPPYAINIGSFPIYLYGIIIAFGFLLAFAYAYRNHGRLDISMDEIYDLVLFAVPSAIIGARLYYVILNFSIYSDDLIGIFRLRDGGLAIYGGVIGATIAVLLRCRHKKYRIGPPLDIMSFGLLIGQSVGRWGNFVNREAYGYETGIFCRMGLQAPGSEVIYVHPTFLYESLWNIAGLIILHIILRKRRKYQGQFFLLYLAWYGLGRALIEGLRTDSLWLVQGVIRASQLFALITFVAASAILIINHQRLKKGLRPLLGGLIESAETTNKTTENKEEI